MAGFAFAIMSKDAKSSLTKVDDHLVRDTYPLKPATPVPLIHIPRAQPLKTLVIPATGPPQTLVSPAILFRWVEVACNLVREIGSCPLSETH